MKAGRKTDHPTSGAGETFWSGPSLALHLSVLTMGQGLTCTRKAIAIFERMFYNPLHTERKQSTESKGKGICVYEDRQQKNEKFVAKIESMNEAEFDNFINRLFLKLSELEAQTDHPGLIKSA